MGRIDRVARVAEVADQLAEEYRCAAAGGAAGLLCPQIPQEYGGPGGSFKPNAIMVVEIGYAGFAGPMTDFSVHSDVCADYLLNAGTEEQKRTWLPRMINASERWAWRAVRRDGEGALQS